MRFIYIFLFILTFCSIGIAQSKIHKTIEMLEHQRFEAMTKRNIPFLEKVLADDVTYAHSNGLVESKSQHLENISSGRIVYQKMDIEKMNIRSYKKTAVVTGIIKVKGLYKDSPFDIRLGFTDVYLKSKKSWKLLAWQSVKLVTSDE